MICYYHDDIDGRCAGAIVSQFTGVSDPEKFFEVNYVQPLPIDEITKDDVVYIVDYSFKEDTLWQLEKIIEKSAHVIWIDHHTSSLELVKQHPELNDIAGMRQEGISGAGLTYMYLHDCQFDDLPYYIKLVSDYDCWKFNLSPDTVDFKLGIETYDYDALDKIWSKLFYNYIDEIKAGGTGTTYIQPILKEGRIIKEYIEKELELYRNSYAYESEILGHKCLVVNRKSNSWIFGDKINDYDCVIVWVFNGERYVYSVYSTKSKIDCSKIAESFGGGGHKGAAGFSSTELLFKKN